MPTEAEKDRWQAVEQKIINDIEHGLKQYGQYTYYDKGAHEVIDMWTLGSLLKEIGPKGAAWVLLRVKEHEHGGKFVQDMLLNLDGWEEFDDLMNESTELADMY